MASLEQRIAIAELRQDMRAGSAADLDRCLAELIVTLRSHTALLQALQERQAENSAILAEHSQRLERLEEGRLASADHDRGLRSRKWAAAADHRRESDQRG